MLKEQIQRGEYTHTAVRRQDNGMQKTGLIVLLIPVGIAWQRSNPTRRTKAKSQRLAECWARDRGGRGVCVCVCVCEEGRDDPELFSPWNQVKESNSPFPSRRHPGIFNILPHPLE